METTSSQWLFCASQPYCLQISITPHTEPTSVQLDWRHVRTKGSQLYLSSGNECRLLNDGDFIVFRLTEIQWQAVVERHAEPAPEQWERLPFTLSELAVHPEFATFIIISSMEAQGCEK
ncbi:hypothetical protein [Xenorhabdus anantnagensis]|uniref:Uncharacterized protein n=1 Tax=Xenorhabdus anantnagensis TaxID=3025875 RepID=A0ABT5LTQ5_9GAMM|nr:hypothetical protein [Xenorhabdus anantnagensis]MDC9597810.1 hypothetical protein [Xenorhabdus anantnagensis]